MADIGIPKNWLVSPTKEIEEMWVKVRIQEKKSLIARYRQDLDDLQNGRMLELQANIKMCELEIRNLENKLIIDVPLSENSEGGQNNG